MSKRIWTQIQLFLALWVIPFTPVSLAAGGAHALGWPAWMISVVILAITWPAAWYVWLMGDTDARSS